MKFFLQISIKRAIGIQNKMLNITHFSKNSKISSLERKTVGIGRYLKLYLSSLEQEMPINVDHTITK
jgi:hypothetical protein